eukprot:9061450-Alexandrium_andersonii.AAC.1
MSASLVGSEMCIRDRFDSGSLARQAAVRGGGGSVRPGAPCGDLGPPRGCLLYTSDAADDMRV